MKAITMRMQKFSRPLVILLATAVVILTTMVVANATQTITTPNAVNISYNLAAGGTSAAITPVTNKSVLVMGCCTTLGSQGVGHVSLLHTSGFMIWEGLESYNGLTPAIAAGDSNGTLHIVYIDFFHHVAILATNSGDAIHVFNSANATQAGNVTLIW
jgi:hypothetical protein